MVRSKFHRTHYLLFLILAVFAVLQLSFIDGTARAQEHSPYKSEPLSIGASLGTSFVDGSTGSVSEENDAGLFLNPRVANDNRRLKAYSADKLQMNKALVPGLAGVANHVLREQVTDTENREGYSLADAMADALWRKQVVDALYRNREYDGDLQ